MSYYAGLTIGPIYKTLMRAENTRSLWGASMLFSYVMQKLVKKAKAEQDIHVILPFFDESFLNTKPPGHIGTGLVPDRLIVQSGQKGIHEKMRGWIAEVIREFPQEIGVGDEVFWQKYIRLYTLGAPFSDETGLADGTNAVGSISGLLNAFELQDLPLPARLDALDIYLDRIPSRLPYQVYFPENKKGFDTLFEIAIRELTTSLQQDDEGYAGFQDTVYQDGTKRKLKKEFDLIKIVKNRFPDHFRACHKYICIVYADGDGIGKLLTKESLDHVKKLSKAMFDFGVLAQGMLNAYGAMPIYIGGDDLLFVAPFRNMHSTAPDNQGDSCQNIFALLNALDGLFKSVMRKYPSIEGVEQTSLSFGLSVSYYKHPMQEAISKAHELLFMRAKNLESKQGIKNNLCCEVRLHAGAEYATSFHLDKAAREPFDQMCSWLKKYSTSDEEEKFFTSVIHKTSADRQLLICLLGKDDADARLANYFTNNFDETDHEQFKPFFKNITVITIELKKAKLNRADNQVSAKLLHEVMDNLHALLRLVKFVNQKDDHE